MLDSWRSVPPIRAFSLAWLALYALDAVVSLPGSAGIGALTTVPLLLSAPLVALAAALTPRVPVRLVGLPLLVLAWAALGAMPIPLWTLNLSSTGPTLGGAWTQTAVAAVQLASLGPVVVAARRLGSWETRPPFAWRRTLALAGAAAVGAPVALLAYGWGSVAYTLHYGTDGFAVLDLRGVQLTERTYARGDTTVHLVGMMHVGEQRAYDELYDAFGELEDAVVLTEGVSDEQHLLPDSLGYGRAAARVDLVQQPPIERDGLVVRRADIDIAEVSPEVRALVEAALGVWSADDPAAAYVDMVRTLDPDDADDTMRRLWDELIERRNQRVLEEIRVAAGDFDHVVVPWGAIHLPGIAAALRDEGWVPVGETRRRLFGYSVVLALLR
jgi:hypothetical protein